MSAKTDSELSSLNNSRLPDNNTRFITADKVRNQTQDIIDSKINKDKIVSSLDSPSSSEIPSSLAVANALDGYVTDAELASALSNYIPTSRTVNGKALSSNISIDKTDVGLGSVDNTSDANKPISTATQTALDLKQDKAIVVSSNQTAVNDGVYHNVATATYTDPSPVEGKGFTVFVRNGTATVGGTAYATGKKIIRTYHSGSWLNDVYSIDSIGTLSPTNSPITTGDTINVFANKTQGQIDALTDKVGVLFEDDFSTNTIANYNRSNPLSYTITGGEMVVSLGTNSFTNKASYALCKVNSEKLLIKTTVRVGELNKRGIYFGLGGSILVQWGLNMTTSSACYLETVGYPASTFGKVNTMSVSVNDIIDTIVSVDGFDATITCINTTTKATLTMYVSNFNYNTRYFDIYSVEGTNYLQEYSVSDTNSKNVELLVIGDSITRMNGLLTNIEDSYLNILQRRFNGIVKLAGGGDLIDVSTEYMTMINKYNPKRVMVFVGANNVSNLALMQTNYTTLIANLDAEGYEVILCTLLDRSGFTATIDTFNAWLYSTFTYKKIINTNSFLTMSSTNYSGDYLHPNKTGNRAIANCLIPEFSDILDTKENYTPNNTIYAKLEYNINNQLGLTSVATAGISNTDTEITLVAKVDWSNAGFFLIRNGATSAIEICRYNGSNATQLTGIQRGLFGTTAQTIASGGNVICELIVELHAKDIATRPTFYKTGVGKMMFNAIENFASDMYTFYMQTSRSITFRGQAGFNHFYTKGSTSNDIFIQIGAVTGGTSYRFHHNTSSEFMLYDITQTAGSGFNINSGSNIGVGLTSTVFRLTNAGADVTSRMFIDPARSLTAGKGYAFDNANGFVFTDANGTRRIATASFVTSNVTTTAGSEKADLDLMTKPSGSAMRTAFRVTAEGSTILGALSALATTATDGFTYIPSCAGVPTGVPTTQTGKIPMVIDSTNNKAYIYSGGAWVALN